MRQSRLLSLGLLLALAAVPAGCSTDKKASSARHLAVGDKYYESKKLEEARIEYQNAVNLDPGNGMARLKLAKALEEGEPQAAYREYIRAADLMPDNVEAQTLAGKWLNAAGQFTEAKTRAMAALAKEPRNAEALLVFGSSLAGLKDLDGAIKQMENAIEADPSRTFTYTNLGAMNIAKGDRQAAESAFKRAVEVAPNSVTAHLSLANYYWGAGQIADAERELKVAFELDRRHPVSNKSLVAFYIGQGNPKEAIRYLKDYTDATQDAGAKLMLADLYVVQKQINEAIAVLHTIPEGVERDPARLRLAAIDFAIGKKPEAYKAIDQLLKEKPADEGALLTKSRFLIRDGKVADIMPLATKVLAGNPKSVPGMYFKGSALEALGRDDEAASMFEEVLKAEPRSVESQLKLAALYLKKGAYELAIQLATSAMQNAPNSPDAHLLYAKALIANKSLAAAEKELNALAKLYPGIAEVHFTLGRFYWTKGDAARAEQAYTRALQLQPDSLEALEGLIGFDLYSKNPGDARKRLDANLSKIPDTSNKWVLAGRTYQALGLSAEAETALRKAIQLDPSNMDAYSKLGIVYMSQKRLDEALKEYDAAAEKNPKSVGAFTMAGIILTMQNKPDEARTRYERALAIDADAAVAANNLAWIMAAKNENLDVALKLAQTAKSKMPKNAGASDTIGWIYYRKNLPNLAVANLKIAAEQDPSNPLIHYHLGLAHLQNKTPGDGRRALERALKINPQFEMADDARRVLAGS